MKIRYLLFSLPWFLFILSFQCEATIYRCESPEGITFSQIPCANNPLEVEAEASRLTPVRKKKKGPRVSVDIENFTHLPFNGDE